MFNSNLPIKDGPTTLYGFRYLKGAFDENFTIETTFVANLFSQSRKRRIAEGCKGLALEAARCVIDFALARSENHYAQEGVRLNWTPGDYDKLAKDIADELIAKETVRSLVMQWLDDHRATIIENPNLTRCDPYIEIRIADISEDQRNDIIQAVGERSGQRVLVEPCIITFNRVLDYIDHLKGSKEHRHLFNLKSSLTSIVRVYNTVFIRA